MTVKYVYWFCNYDAIGVADEHGKEITRISGMKLHASQLFPKEPTLRTVARLCEVPVEQLQWISDRILGEI